MQELANRVHHVLPENFRSSRLVELRTRSGSPEALLITGPDVTINRYGLIPTVWTISVSVKTSVTSSDKILERMARSGSNSP